MSVIRYLLIFCLINFTIICAGQNDRLVLLRTDHCNHLIAGIDNHISLLINQADPFSITQVSATLLTASSYINNQAPRVLEVSEQPGGIKIRSDSVGLVELKIAVGDTTIRENLRVKPMQAVCRLSRFGPDTEGDFPVDEFKAQRGVAAYIECCDINAVCRVETYEIIRIAKAGSVERNTNQGARFGLLSLAIIEKAKPGDLYVFKDIHYRCPGGEIQRADNISFEIE